MPLEQNTQHAIGPGTYTGIIEEATITQRSYGAGRPPQDALVVTIRPKDPNAPAGVEVLPVNVDYTPKLNGLSNLSKLLARLGATPEEGETWEESSLIGTEVQFTAKRNGNFVNVVKDSVRAAE